MTQRCAHIARGQVGHFFNAHHQRDFRAPRLDRIAGGKNRGRAAGACIFQSCRRLETQILVDGHCQGCRKAVRHQSAVEMTHPDAVHIACGQGRMGQRLAPGLDDQIFQISLGMFAEFRVTPTNDLNHRTCLSVCASYCATTVARGPVRLQSVKSAPCQSGNI